MRIILSIMTLLLATTLAAQTRDRRALLDIPGSVHEISVSPEGKIWLVSASGTAVYTDHLDGNWHTYTSMPGVSADPYEFKNPNLERINFFDEKRAILSGYISSIAQGHDRSGYYLTEDGGKTWQLKNFGGSGWIYEAYSDRSGRAWMGTAGKTIHYSSDYGQNWKALTLNMKKSDRIYAIHMLDGRRGLAGSDNNELMLTKDNWRQITTIPTPLDQKMYAQDPSRLGDERFFKVRFWKEHIVVNQQGHIFYSDHNTIAWKSFPKGIHAFEVDDVSQSLYAISTSGEILRFQTPDEYETLPDARLDGPLADLKIVNGSLYMLGRGSTTIYQYQDHRLRKTMPYTIDYKIQPPATSSTAGQTTWGIDGQHIYISEAGTEDWWRENIMPFYVFDIAAISDSQAILFDIELNSYLYSRADHQAKPYKLSDPFSAFLASPIDSIIIRAGSQSCYHHLEHKVDYARNAANILEVVASENTDTGKGSFSGTINPHAWTDVLHSINEKPYQTVSIADFHFTDADFQAYTELVDSLIHAEKPTSRFDLNNIKPKTRRDSAFYAALPGKLDTISSTVLEAIFRTKEGWYSTTSNWFVIDIVNTAGEKLRISRVYYTDTHAWHLPWNIVYNQRYISSCQASLSRLIKDAIPPDFYDRQVFSNAKLLLEIADYLWKHAD